MKTKYSIKLTPPYFVGSTSLNFEMNIFLWRGQDQSFSKRAKWTGTRDRIGCLVKEFEYLSSSFPFHSPACPCTDAIVQNWEAIVSMLALWNCQHFGTMKLLTYFIYNWIVFVCGTWWWGACEAGYINFNLHGTDNRGDGKLRSFVIHLIKWVFHWIIQQYFSFG